MDILIYASKEKEKAEMQIQFEREIVGVPVDLGW